MFLTANIISHQPPVTDGNYVFRSEHGFVATEDLDTREEMVFSFKGIVSRDVVSTEATDV
jgi:hypothetical protein